MRRNIFLLVQALCLVGVGIAVLLWTSTSSRAASGTVSNGKACIRTVRHYSAADHTRVVIELDRKVSYSHNTLGKKGVTGSPQRVYVDLSDTRCPPNLLHTKSLPVGPIKSVRIGQFDKRTTRVVMDVRDMKEYKIGTLTCPDRVFIDFWKERKGDAVAASRKSASRSDDEATGTEGTGAGSASSTTDSLAGGNTASVVVPPSRALTQAKQSPQYEAASDGVTKGKEHAASKLEPLHQEPPPRSNDQSPERPASTYRIVLDPGHGGSDPGAIGACGVMEKDVTLRIARLLKKKLEESVPCEVFLTRNSDIYLTLGKRTAIANLKKADLFVSIHVNANHDSSISGIETYYLDNTTDKAAIRLAAFENASSGHGTTDLQRILADLKRNNNVLESNTLAHVVQNALVGELSRGYKGVIGHGAKANLFYVLIGAEMPSILVEVSYITNREEEKRLQNERYLESIADGIRKGIHNYVLDERLPTLQAQR